MYVKNRANDLRMKARATRERAALAIQDTIGLPVAGRSRSRSRSRQVAPDVRGRSRDASRRAAREPPGAERGSSVQSDPGRLPVARPSGSPSPARQRPSKSVAADLVWHDSGLSSAGELSTSSESSSRTVTAGSSSPAAAVGSPSRAAAAGSSSRAVAAGSTSSAVAARSPPRAAAARSSSHAAAEGAGEYWNLTLDELLKLSEEKPYVVSVNISYCQPSGAPTAAPSLTAPSLTAPSLPAGEPQPAPPQPPDSQPPSPHWQHSQPLVDGGSGGRPSEGKRLAVLGSGDYGRALAGRAALCGWDVTLGSRRPGGVPPLADGADVRLAGTEQAAAAADLVVACVPARFYGSLPISALAGKVVVDVSNGAAPLQPDQPSNAEYLQQLVPTARVVKAFNVVSAYALERGLQGGKQVFVAGDSASARSRVSSLVADLGFFPIDLGGLRSARHIESLPRRLFPAWHGPGSICALMLLLFWLYLLAREQVCATAMHGGPWTLKTFQPLLMVNVNKALAMTAGTVLAGTYLPGVLAGYLQLYRGTKYRRFPGWLDRWLRMRKQLGLLMLAMASLHACMSTAIWSPRYLGLLYHAPSVIEAELLVAGNQTRLQPVTVYNNGMHWRGEAFLSAGAVALGLLVVVGITSLPGVGAALSWREFMFVQSGLGWSALLAATGHATLLAVTPETIDFRCWSPPPLQVSLYLPALTVLLKLPLVLPGVAGHLSAIRGGHERKKYFKKSTDVDPGAA